jgi:transcriptional regulator with XRE-family HTH domain
MGVASELATVLRWLRRSRGMSQRELAKLLFLRAHSAVADYESGRRIPAVDIIDAYESVFAVPGQLHALRVRELRLRAREELAPFDGPDEVAVASALPPQPVADGSDPDAAGCGHDAVIVGARKVSMRASQYILGQVELRYSVGTHAAWGRFLGYSSLDHLAHDRRVEILVEIARDAEPPLSCRGAYAFDYHWTDLLVTSSGEFRARTEIFFDEESVAEGSTDSVALGCGLPGRWRTDGPGADV